MKAVLISIAVLATALAVYKVTNRSKEYYAKFIISKGGHTSFATLITFDEAFLKAWTKALGKAKTNFLYNSETYSTKGGKKIQS